MPRYIDADERKQHIASFAGMFTDELGFAVSIEAVLEALDSAPAADVVEVVRCKDCAFAKKNYLVNGLCLCEKTIHDVVKGEMPRNTVMDEDDFCSYGERKE